MSGISSLSELHGELPQNAGSFGVEELRLPSSRCPTSEKISRTLEFLYLKIATPELGGWTTLGGSYR